MTNNALIMKNHAITIQNHAITCKPHNNHEKTPILLVALYRGTLNKCGSGENVNKTEIGCMCNSRGCTHPLMDAILFFIYFLYAVVISSYFILFLFSSFFFLQLPHAQSGHTAVVVVLGGQHDRHGSLATS